MRSGTDTMMKSIDIFCGAGGLTRGLLNAGLDVVAGFDADGSLRDTYERNNPKSTFVHNHVQKVTAYDVLDHRSVSSNDDLVLVGCAPCQSFSTLIRDLRRRPDARLLGEFGRLVELVRPAVVVMENVPGIARVPGYSTYRRFLATLRRCEYEIDVAILNAKDFGVPQNRRRLVLMASRTFKPSLPEPTHGANGQGYETVRRTVSMYPALKAGERHPSIPNHVTSSLSELSLKRIRATPHNGGGWHSWPRELKLDCHIRSPEGHSDVYGRLRWDTPAPTLTSRCTSISNGRFAHPEQDRGISLREAAALQSFPDDYIFHGTHSGIARQIGNAVPVKLAEAIGRQILKLAGSV